MYTMTFFKSLTDQFARATAPSERGWSFMESLIRFDAAARQFRHLEELPDYLLKDIGLTRADLKRTRGK